MERYDSTLIITVSTESITVPNLFLRVDALQYATKKCEYISTLDLKSGYWQMPMKVEDRDAVGKFPI